jgi:hypothetical protein
VARFAAMAAHGFTRRWSPSRLDLGSGGVFSGGAWLRVEGRPVDVHYRDLDDVEHQIAEAGEGRFRIERLMFHLAGVCRDPGSALAVSGFVKYYDKVWSQHLAEILVPCLSRYIEPMNT